MILNFMKNKGYISEIGKLGPKLALLLLAKIGKKDTLIKKLSAYPPVSATIHITENCNSRCITCNQWRKQTTDEMTTEDIKSALEQLREAGCARVGFGGGEPLLRRDIGQIVGYAKSLGFKRISLVTNGLLLDQKKEELVENGITDISVSIDGIGETHDNIRGIKRYFTTIMQAVDGLKKLQGERRFSIGVNTTLLRENADEIPTLLDLCEEKNLSWGFNLLDTSPYFFDGIDYEQLLIKGDEEIDRLMDYIKGRKRRNARLIRTSYASIEYAKEYLKTRTMSINCYLGMLSVYIGSQGQVYSGCYAMNPLGNLRENTLREIMTANAYKKRVLQMYKKECPGCTCNYGNNVRIESIFKR